MAELKRLSKKNTLVKITKDTSGHGFRVGNICRTMDSIERRTSEDYYRLLRSLHRVRAMNAFLRDFEVVLLP